ncbi:MAG TPA: ABC transporter ATP-binding protein [Jatrophihabitans sp.]|nr:ABC transporter ATP-binding protein [Jatrophihabitans sp.]
MTAPAVELRSVRRDFATSSGDMYTAVHGIDLTIPHGRFVSVVGPTGCGKSTVLNMAAGLLAPTEGDVLSFGQPLAGINARAGYLFQQETLLPWKSIVDNVKLGLTMRGVSGREAKQQARSWLKRVGLAGFEDRYPHQLSGGMRKRASIAQVWVTDPDILLMDEPFSALDVQTRQVMENELLQLWQGSDKSVLCITHDLDEAIALSDEVVLLSSGPGSSIVGRYEVDLPRPRDLLTVRDEPGFGRIYNEIWSQLRQEVMKTYAGV